MSGVLDAILAAKREEIAALTRRRRDTTRETHERRANVVRELARDARDGALRLIAEHKRRSPSAGALSVALSPAERALKYVEGGATMVSVLCDAPFFDGSWDHVRQVRDTFDAEGSRALVLAKEFVLDEVQLDAAAEAGADAVLLIARIVSAARLGELVAAARDAGLEPLVEIVDERELRAALDADAKVIGVNARDLDTLTIDVARAGRLLADIPEGRVAVHLSGLKSADDVRHVATTSADAALIGEALMRLDDPVPLLREMAAAARPLV